MSELMPCPFCGGEAKQVSQTFLGVEHKWIQCVPCGGSSNVEAWNRRPTPPQSGDGDVAKVREFVSDDIHFMQYTEWDESITHEVCQAFERLVERLAAAEAAAHEHWQRGARDADAELGNLAVALNKAESRLARVEKLHRHQVVLAYQSAYGRGHNDTVEGCYNGSFEDDLDTTIEALTDLSIDVAAPPPSGDGDVQRLRELFAALLEAAQSSNYNDCVEDSNAFERLVERLAAAEDAARSMSADVTKFGARLARVEELVGDGDRLRELLLHGIDEASRLSGMSMDVPRYAVECVEDVVRSALRTALARDGEGD